MTDGIVDGYAHCGLTKFLPVDDLIACMKSASVSRAVLVQHFGEYDNSYLAETIRQHPGTFVAVGLIDPFQQDWPHKVAYLVSLGFRGLRLKVEWLRTHMHVALAAAEAGLNLMIYLPDDMLGGVPLIRRLARDASDRSVVVSHLGAPRVSDSTLVEGLELLDLATESNILVTLSGLSMYTPHPHLEMAGLVTTAIEQFGSGRVMWGSNFSVCLEAESYGDDLALILEGQWGLDDSAIADIIGGSSSRVWFDSP